MERERERRRTCPSRLLMALFLGSVAYTRSEKPSVRDSNPSPRKAPCGRPLHISLYPVWSHVKVHPALIHQILFVPAIPEPGLER